MKLAVLTFLSIQIFFFAQAEDSIGVVQKEGKKFIQYQVSAGNTIYSISKKYQISLPELQKINPELNNGLKAQQIILIPFKKEVKTQVSETKIIKNELETNKKNPEFKKEQKDEVKKEVETFPLEIKATQTTISNRSNTIPIEEDFKGKRILVIPFDPYLYFSDADDEIAKASNLDRTKIRTAFRKRLNALLEPDGYNTIHLLGGKTKDSLTDLNRVYKSIKYSYKDVIFTDAHPNIPIKFEDQKTISINDQNKNRQEMNHSSNSSLAKNPGKYWGLDVKDPNFFSYFETKYKIDYYIFVNQFEVKTNYENCLDRSRQNYERNFITHYTILDKMGTTLAGHRINKAYESNANQIQKILSDNMDFVAKEILKDLPK